MKKNDPAKVFTNPLETKGDGGDAPGRNIAADEFIKALTGSKEGDEEAKHKLWTMTYNELKRLARNRLRQSKPGRTISTTVLVHEAYLKLGSSGGLKVEDRSHFLALSCRAMRQILVQYVREKNAHKRMAHQKAVTFEENISGMDPTQINLLAINQVLNELEQVDKRLVQVVECRFFGGLSADETAEVLKVSSRTVERDWVKAKLYLFKALEEPQQEAES